MQPNENVVRQFAYQIWESEGKPEGQHARHWEMACKLAAGEMGPSDPFEPLSNIKTYAVSPDEAAAPSNSSDAGLSSGSQAGAPGNQQASSGGSQVSASMEAGAPAKAPRSRAKTKVVIEDPDAAPKKRAPRSSKKTQQAT